MVAVKTQYRLSRSDYDWRAAKTPSKPAAKGFSGFIFVCDESTRRDLGRMVFGLPASYRDKVRVIRRGMPLFLYNFSERLLYGVFEAASDGGFNLDPYAWEDTDSKSGRSSNPVSKYPAQVRIRVRAERDALDEESFRSILDCEGQGFKLDLNARQVQQLIQLFDSSAPVGRNIETRSSSAVESRDPESPGTGYKSDSYCSSDCSSKGVNSGEDEWNDEAVNKKMHYQREDDQSGLSERLNHMDIEESEHNDRHCQVPNTSGEIEGTPYYNVQCEGHSQKLEYANSMLRRLHDDDPAVNSNSCLQTRGYQSLTVNRQDNCMDNMMVKCQQQENPNFASRSQNSTKWSDQNFSRSSSGHLRKQSSVQDNIPRSTDHTQQMPTENCQIQESNSFPGQLPVSMPQNAEGLTFTQPQTVEDVQVFKEKNQHLIQNGPIVFVPSQGRVFVEDLHYEILNFARSTRPSQQVQCHVEAAIVCVREGVKRVWPEANVEVFGSFATGLCLQHSDVDLAVIDAPRETSLGKLTMTQASSDLVRKLAEALRTYEWCESINPLDTASMPVLKCLCRPFTTANAPSIAVDITIGGIKSRNPSSDQAPRPGKFSSRHTGGAARDYVLQKIRELPALAPLVLLLKSFLHHKGLSNVYSGGLGSFSLTLLVAFYLERIHVPRDICSDGGNGDSPTSLLKSSPLSCSSEFSDDSDTPSTSGRFSALSSRESNDHSSHCLGERYVRRAADAIEGVLSHWGHGSSPCLGKLLLGFLHSFGVALDLSREKIVLNGIDGSLGGIYKREDPHIALWIDDPLRPGVNIGAGSYGMGRVRNAFKEMLDVLVTPSMFASPPLRCEDKRCQDLASFAQLRNLSQLMNAADGY